MKKSVFFLFICVLHFFGSCEKEAINEQKLEDNKWIAHKTERVLNGDVIHTINNKVSLSRYSYDIQSISFSNGNALVDVQRYGEVVLPYTLIDGIISFALPLGNAISFEVVKATNKELVLREKVNTYSHSRDNMLISAFNGLDIYEYVYYNNETSYFKYFSYYVNGIEHECEIYPDYFGDTSRNDTFGSVNVRLKTFTEKDINNLSTDDYNALKTILKEIDERGFHCNYSEVNALFDYLLTYCQDKYDWYEVAKLTNTEEQYNYAKELRYEWQKTWENTWNGKIYVGLFLYQLVVNPGNRLACDYCARLAYPLRNLDNPQELIELFNAFYKDNCPLPFIMYKSIGYLGKDGFLIPYFDKLYFSIVDKGEHCWYDTILYTFKTE